MAEFITVAMEKKSFSIVIFGKPLFEVLPPFSLSIYGGKIDGRKKERWNPK